MPDKSQTTARRAVPWLLYIGSVGSFETLAWANGKPGDVFIVAGIAFAIAAALIAINRECRR